MAHRYESDPLRYWAAVELSTTPRCHFPQLPSQWRRHTTYAFLVRVGMLPAITPAAIDLKGCPAELAIDRAKP